MKQLKQLTYEMVDSISERDTLKLSIHAEIPIANSSPVQSTLLLTRPISLFFYLCPAIGFRGAVLFL